MAGDGGVIAKDRIFGHRLARPHRLEERLQVRTHVVPVVAFVGNILVHGFFAQRRIVLCMPQAKEGSPKAGFEPDNTDLQDEEAWHLPTLAARNLAGRSYDRGPSIADRTEYLARGPAASQFGLPAHDLHHQNEEVQDLTDVITYHSARFASCSSATVSRNGHRNYAKANDGY